ncbi:hypothetical protein CVT26_004050 [Gymnopilus dilepis]|uniref:Uncharacterized protein n=1 Tax=Gymnopilus dilepis TaxID=231916 RepID=A0A409WKZ2_9AGAR|nr:hypothetical protein CVT26_004050 [Gymnopilus dilepis]
MEPYGHDMPYANPNAQWGRSQLPSAAPYSPINSDYGRRSGYFPQQSMQHGPMQGIPPGGQFPMEHMQGFNPGVNPSQGMLDPDLELDPLEEFYDNQPPRPPSRRSMTAGSPNNMQLAVPGQTFPSQLFAPNPALPRYSSSRPAAIPLPESSYGHGYGYRRDRHSRSRSRSLRRSRRDSYEYDSHRDRERYPSRSYRRSYSDDSYSRGRSYRSGRHSSRHRDRDRDRYPYHDAYSRSSTVVHQSRRHPTVVPLNGGYGGYVVVPAKGQRVRVMVSLSLFLLLSLLTEDTDLPYYGVFQMLGRTFTILYQQNILPFHVGLWKETLLGVLTGLSTSWLGRSLHYSRPHVVFIHLNEDDLYFSKL